MLGDKKESIEIIIARLEERIVADRDNNTLHFQNINENINKLLSQMMIISADSEADRLQLNLMIEKLDRNNNKTDQIEDDLDVYKGKMKHWEVFQEWKRVPFYTFMLLFIVSSKDEIVIFIEMIIKKFTGS